MRGVCKACSDGAAPQLIVRLLRKNLCPFHLKLPSDRRCSGIGLSSADRNRILSIGDHRFTCLGHHAQVAFFQFEANLLRFSGLQMNTLECTQRTQRSSGNVWEAEINLRHFVSFTLASVCERYIHDEWIAGLDRILWNSETGVSERRVAQSISERIQRRTFEIAVRPVVHCVVSKRW